STIFAEPQFTNSIHSVSERKITHGFLKKNASFCTPPESVIINCAAFSKAIISKNETGSIILIYPFVFTVLYNSDERFFDNNFAVLGCKGIIILILFSDAILFIALNNAFNRNGSSVLLFR